MDVTKLPSFYNPELSHSVFGGPVEVYAVFVRMMNKADNSLEYHIASKWLMDEKRRPS